MNDPQGLLQQMFDAAVTAASDFSGMGALIQQVPGRVLIIGFGKASLAMARALEADLPDWLTPDRLSGFVVQPDAGPRPLRHLDVLTAPHPVPDARSEAAGLRALRDAGALTADDLLVALASGGGSALMAAPQVGVTLEEKIGLNRSLLAAGVPIQTMNAARIRLSRIKGGGLAQAAAPARVVTMIVSDIPGDAPWAVASGPTLTCPDSSAHSISNDITARLDPMSDAMRALLLASPEPLSVSAHPVHVLADADKALSAAERLARAQGLAVINLGGAVQGDAGAVARQHADQILALGQVTRPTVLLSGGETTVQVRGNGRGGRNAHYLLELVVALEGRAQVHALAADTDGIDGCGPEAGARIDPSSLSRARQVGVDPAVALGQHDSLGFFSALNDAILTGPTGTNVNDFRAILLRPA